MELFFSIVFGACWLALAYVYGGYYFCLRIAALGRRAEMPPEAARAPKLSVIVAACNEEASIAARIGNLLASDYPADRLEIIIASDGSTDGTAERARAFAGVRVLEFSENRGRAAAHNDAVAAATGEVVVFTDAQTEFRPDFLSRLAAGFVDPQVGCVVGNLVYRSAGSNVAEAEGLYWRTEKETRKLESRAGILATGTGACMGVRRHLWQELAGIDDCDFASPLDVILQGSRVAYAEEAVAYDIPSSNLQQEFKTRVRQTSKNLLGTCRHWGWRGLFSHPLVSWGLCSHKVLRWLSPFFLAGLLLSNLLLLPAHVFFQATLAGQGVFYAFVLAGLLEHWRWWKVPYSSVALSFCVANAGMGVGVILALAGSAPTSYSKEGL